MVGGERLVDRAVRVLTEAGCSPVVVVLGAWVGEVPASITVVNEHWREGMGSSLRAGLSYLMATPASNVLVTLVDLPGLTATACSRIVQSKSMIAAAAYDGVRGHPVKFNREHWLPLIEMAHGDQGARAYLTQRSDIEIIEVSDVATGIDLDFNPAAQNG